MSNVEANNGNGDAQNDEHGGPASPADKFSEQESTVAAGHSHDATLASLLDGRGVGARLEGLLRSTPVGSMTFREYSADPRWAIAWMLRHPNCGRKTVAELVELIDRQPSLLVEPPRQWPEPPLPDTRLSDLLSADTLSVRLLEVLRTTDLGNVSIPEFVKERGRLEAEMLRVPNCGRKSVAELRRLVGAHIRQQLEEIGANPSDYGAQITDLAAAAPESTASADQPPAACDLPTLVSWHLGRLVPRTAEIIALRFGLGDRPPKTLSDIGEDYALTRERIRQIEAKGLKAMQAACRRFPVRPAVDEVTPSLLATIFDGSQHVSGNRADRGLSALDGWHELALRLAHGSPDAWLRKHARKLGGGWLALGTDPADVRSAANELRRRFKSRPFPLALTEVVNGLEFSPCLAAMDLILDWRVEAGYVFTRRPGPRLLRTARLHALLSLEREPLEMAPLLRCYHAAVSTDPCTDRDLVIVMEAASHLFLEIHEGCWAALGPAATLNPVEASIKPQAPVPPMAEEGTNATALERELARVGPSRMGDLMARAIDILPTGRSRHSVGPTLLLNPNRFVRILPGVYALPHQVLDGRSLVEAGHIDYLLNRTQARFYAIGRKAGERWGAYPLWTPTAEMRLCRWARAGDDRALYRSLLDVASVELWPTDEADKEIWRDLKARDGRYELWCDRRLTGTRPPIERVLAAAIRVARCGTIGWVAANRVLGYVPSSYAGAGLLDGMVAAGMVMKPPGEIGWQLPHGRGPDLDHWITLLGEILHRTGTVEWGQGAGINLAKVFALNKEEPSGSTSSESEDELDEYEQIMAEHRLALQTRRIEARLELEIG
jgi:hypothetical protein